MPNQPPVQVALTPEALQQISAQVSDAVRVGIRGAMTEETAAMFWSAGVSVFQKQATTHAGRFVLGGIWGLFRRAGMFMVLGGVVYAIGGWAALAALGKSLFTTGGQ